MAAAGWRTGCQQLRAGGAEAPSGTGPIRIPLRWTLDRRKSQFPAQQGAWRCSGAMASHGCHTKEEASCTHDTMEAPGRLFCFGLGYTALGLASVLLEQGWDVAGTTRQPSKMEAAESTWPRLRLFLHDPGGDGDLRS